MVQTIEHFKTGQFPLGASFFNKNNNNVMMIIFRLQGNASFADFISRCEEKPDVSGHRLTFFLLKPLQRLTKYPLLIKNVSQSTILSLY